jgi:hypothetical protein
MIEAQDYLDKAHFFIERARDFEARDRIQFRYHFETAIVWARSVTFVLQKQYSKVPGFTDWYVVEQGVLNSNPLAQFFKGKRNIVLKEKGVHLRKMVQAEMTAHVTIHATATIEVIRGSWRSKIRYFHQDVLADLMQRIRRIERRFSRKRPKQFPRRTLTTEHMCFVESPWDLEPALDLLDKYLELLQLLVNDAVTQFGDPG